MWQANRAVRNPKPRVVLGSVVALIVSACIARGRAEESDDVSSERMSSVSVTVLTDSGQPVQGAAVTVLKWTGDWEDIGVRATSDTEGKAKVTRLPTDTYLSVRVGAVGYASTMHDVEFSEPEDLELVLRLAPPAVPSIQVIDDDGHPIAGAEIHRMEIVDANKGSVYLTQRTAESLAVDLLPSDQNGRLSLPPVPLDATLTLSVVHPNYKTGTLRGLKAHDGELASLTLKPGVRFQIELIPGADVPESLDGLVADVKLYTRASGTNETVSIIHPFTVKDNRIDLTAYQREYSQLSVEMADYFVTPDLINVPDSPVPQLNLSSGKLRRIQLNVRRKARATGKVVDSAGKPLEGVSIYSSINAISPQWPELGVDAGRMAQLRRKWASGGDAKTKQDGSYQLMVSRGPASLEAIHMGFFSSPSTTYFDVAGDGVTEIPTLTLHRVPTLKGFVRDARGRGIGDILVRMRSLGYGDAEPVAATKPDGSFSLKMTRIPYAKTADGLVDTVYVVAVDPKSDQAGMSAVAVTDQQATANIEVSLASRSADWVLNPLAELESEEDPEVTQREHQRIARVMKELPEGVAGMRVPDLHEGTWLNTDARSLDEFRGKYVLLDFWFIGCGPCIRDMPSVKMAHQMFSERGFSVVSVHRKGQTPDSVQAFADANRMNYPIVVDDADGTITEAYKSLGVVGYPSYILLDREGKILHNDNVSPRPSLRQYKLEKIYHALHR